MSIWIGLFLGIVQGFTEFLPVSSSGHLILFQHIFNLPQDMLLFDIILHIATLLAVVFVFRKTIMNLIRRPLCKMNLYLLISTVITCALVILFKDFVDRLFTYKILPFTFMLTAILLYVATWSGGCGGDVRTPSAINVGLSQFVAVTPGLSRSGTTISTLLICGVEKEKAAEYSFLMSIPIILASFCYELLDVIKSGQSIHLDIWPTVIGFFGAMLSGVIAIKFMLRVIKNVKLHWFSLYLVILAIVTGLWFFVF
jgi:undecaprenyl-diphosphatase